MARQGKMRAAAKQAPQILLCVLLLAAATLHANAIMCGPSQIQVFDMYEATLALPALPPTTNIFNQSQLQLSATVALPGGGGTTTILGFVYQAFNTTVQNDAEHDVASGPIELRIRYTPQTLGSYNATFRLTVKGNASEVGRCSFASTPSTSPTQGFVRVGPNRQHFALSTGPDYVPIGENLAWTDSKGVASFADYLANISRAGGNYVRLWLTDQWDDLFLETALGNISLANAHHLDAVVASAQTHGVRLLMCIESFNLFCSNSNAPCNWDTCVYNVKNGGLLTRAQDFFTDKRAKAFFKQRLAYLAARWGYSPSVFAWEFFNEADITDEFDPEIHAMWVQEMAIFLRSRDPYTHPISTSFCCHDVHQVYRLDVVDFAMTHSYGNADAVDMADNTQAAARRQAAEYHKPMLLAETGETPGQFSGQADPSGRGMHNAMWAALTTRAAGTAMMWWWDSWVGAYDLYSHYVAVAAFVQRVAWSQHTWSALPLALLDQSSVHVRVLASVGAALTSQPTAGNTTAVVWLQNMNNTYVKQNASLPAAQRAELNAVNGLVFSLPGPFATGQYLAQWTNTSTGHIVRTDTVTCEGNAVFATCMALRLEVPDFVLDVALVLNYTISARQANPDSEASEEPIVPGSPSPAFTLELLNGSSIRYTPEDTDSPLLPLVVYAHNTTDPFTVAMFTSNTSIDTFLQQAPVPCVNFLFLADTAGGTQALQSRLSDRLQVAANISAAARVEWPIRWLFAAAPIAQLLANSSSSSLLGPVQQWPEYARGFAFPAPAPGMSWLPRLDGHFQYCNIVARDNHSPSDPTEPWPPEGARFVQAYGDVCAPPTTDFAGQFVLADMTGTRCQPDTVAQHIIALGNATGVALMAAAEEPLIQLGVSAFEDQGLWDGNDNHGFCSMVAHNEDLLQAFRVAGSSGLSLQYAAIPRPGSFFGIDHNGHVQEMGAPLNPSLMLLGWQAQGLEYQAQLAANLSQPAMVVSALHAVGQSAAATVPMPGPAIMAAFDTVHLEARMSCQGSFDSDCDMWDHVHTVAADCWDASGASLGLQASAATRVEEQDVAPNEIGRWITPYRRRVGHWLTPVTPWLAVLGSAQACNFTLAASDNGHPWVFDLLLRFTASGASAGAPRPHKLVQLFNTSELSTFDSTYNQRPTLHVQAPAGGARSARLSAIITGHGTMEFAPSRHVFVVNGQEYNVTYLEPLNQWGCSDKAREGVEPNGYGAWWYGRNGWCNGWHVRPWTVDVSAAASLKAGTTTTVKYFAQAYDAENSSFVQPNQPDGYLRVTSNIVFEA